MLAARRELGVDNTGEYAINTQHSDRWFVADVAHEKSTLVSLINETTVTQFSSGLLRPSGKGGYTSRTCPCARRRRLPLVRRNAIHTPRDSDRARSLRCAAIRAHGGPGLAGAVRLLAYLFLVLVWRDLISDLVAKMCVFIRAKRLQQTLTVLVAVILEALGHAFREPDGCPLRVSALLSCEMFSSETGCRLKVSLVLR